MFKEWGADLPWDKVTQEQVRQQLEATTRENLSQLKDAFWAQNLAEIEWKFNILSANDLNKINTELYRTKFADKKIVADWDQKIMTALQWKWVSPDETLSDLNFV
ncbi:MAG: hypothetical protein ACD_3C00183G0007 [uncultured bacterium (gcode 4)]|uniref:Uncharacterized protein n=1 Tax=uncultured bacterium (gcode 4) TaxID=1234023 RepID=K2GBU2_9BACT|nr:MAG: hypothetical protein ACD_3C00183G0007 [uncultured bacterium (gcode 4)]